MKLFVMFFMAYPLLAYRDGARENSCYNHAIDHGPGTDMFPCVSPSCPFFLRIREVVNKNTLELGSEIDTYQCGELYGIELATRLNRPEGFLIQARNGIDVSSEILGQFLDPTNVGMRINVSVNQINYKILRCNRSVSDTESKSPLSNSATHPRMVDMANTLQLYWQAPDCSTCGLGDVRIWFTVVQQLQTVFTTSKTTTLQLHRGYTEPEECIPPPTTTSTTDGLGSSSTQDTPTTSPMTTATVATAGPVTAVTITAAPDVPPEPILTPPDEIQSHCSHITWRNSPDVSCEDISGYDVRLFNPDTKEEVVRHVDARGTFHNFLLLDKDLTDQKSTTVQIRVVSSTEVGNYSSPVEVGCFVPQPPSVYFELKGKRYDNNSMVSILAIGEGDNALLCKTNKQDCCGTPQNRCGEFYYPNGVRVPIRIAGQGFYRNRGDQLIRLNRRGGASPPTGKYFCEIPDADGVTQKIFINIE